MNITTAMSSDLSAGRNSAGLHQADNLGTNSLRQDRFFAWCDPQMLKQVRLAAAQGKFAPESAPWIVHPGATASWKRLQFGEANVQLSFHENDEQVISGLTCIKVEPDIDYYKDPINHVVLEVLPNAITGGLSNPADGVRAALDRGQASGKCRSSHRRTPSFNAAFGTGGSERTNSAQL